MYYVRAVLNLDGLHPRPYAIVLVMRQCITISTWIDDLLMSKCGSHATSHRPAKRRQHLRRRPSSWTFRQAAKMSWLSRSFHWNAQQGWCYMHRLRYGATQVLCPREQSAEMEAILLEEIGICSKCSRPSENLAGNV